MSTIRAILEPDADGTLHLPLPPELRNHPIKVTAELEPVTVPDARPQSGLWKDLPNRFWISADFEAPLEDFS